MVRVSPQGKLVTSKPSFARIFSHSACAASIRRKLCRWSFRPSDVCAPIEKATKARLFRAKIGAQCVAVEVAAAGCLQRFVSSLEIT